MVGRFTRKKICLTLVLLLFASTFFYIKSNFYSASPLVGALVASVDNTNSFVSDEAQAIVSKYFPQGTSIDNAYTILKDQGFKHYLISPTASVPERRIEAVAIYGWCLVGCLNIQIVLQIKENAISTGSVRMNYSAL